MIKKINTGIPEKTNKRIISLLSEIDGWSFGYDNNSNQINISKSDAGFTLKTYNHLFKHINNDGTWFWNKTAQSSATPGVELYKDGPNFMTRAANGGTVLGLNDSTGTNGDIMRFYYQDVHRGSLNFNGSNFAAVNASDYRLKENDTPISDGITRVKQLRPITFNWKTDSSTIHDGFFAHEVQNVVPAAVIGEKDSTIGSRGEGYQMMSNEALIPLLTAAIKELIVKVEALESA
jgi:hypothetical protein